MSDLLPLVDALGGGLSAFIIAGLGWFCVILWRQNQQLHEKRMEDFRDFAASAAERDREQTEALAGNAAAIRELTLQLAMRGRGDA